MTRSAEPRRVLIAGCGYVGTELGLRLAAAGDRAFGLRRRTEGLPTPIRPIAADLLDPGLADRLPPVDAVVHAASADGSTPEGYRAAYVESVRNLLDALMRGPHRPARVIFVSSTAVWGDREGGWVDEGTPPDPDSFRGELVLEGERLVREGPIPGVVLRLGGIYGPGRRRLIERVRAGEATCPEPGGAPLWSNRIHRDDAARAIAHILGLPEPEPLYAGVDEEPAPLCDVVRFLARRLGAPEPRIASDRSRERSNKRVSSRRLRASGYAFRYPSYREGYAAILAGETGADLHPGDGAA